MSNPFLVQVPFAYQGNKNTIQLERQQSQDEEDATYKAGFPPVTMAKEELGGKPPKGLDFNGIFYELSSPIAHYCKGGRIYFDQEYANAIDGYPKGHIVASNDHSKDFISLIDNNTLDPNSNNITGYWSIYSGQGSIPTASSTISGTVKLVNNLNSGAVDAALTAAQGKVLNDQSFGINQSVKGFIGKYANTTYTNTTDKVIFISIRTGYGVSSTNNQVIVDGEIWMYFDTYLTYSSYISFPVPPKKSYRVNTNVPLTHWSELS